MFERDTVMEAVALFISYLYPLIKKEVFISALTRRNSISQVREWRGNFRVANNIRASLDNNNVRAAVWDAGCFVTEFIKLRADTRHRNVSRCLRQICFKTNITPVRAGI